MSNNNYPIKGTIYNIEVETIQGKKKPGETYQKYLITLEVKDSREITYKDKKTEEDKTGYKAMMELPQFEWFNPKGDVTQFTIGDFVEIRFYLSGKEYTRRTGEKAGTKGIMTKNIITHMGFADIPITGEHNNHKGKVKVDAMSDVEELDSKVTDFPTTIDYDNLPF
jgi:hypothetical protein